MKNVTSFVNVDKRDESKSVSNENNEVKRNNFESSNKSINLSLEQFDEVDMMDKMISDGERCKIFFSRKNWIRVDTCMHFYTFSFGSSIISCYSKGKVL